MRAVMLAEPHGLSALTVREVPDPPVAPDQLQIRVAASGVSHLDLICVRGDHQLRPTPPFVPGVEVAGTVMHAPADSGFAAGERVMAYVDLGGYAEIANADPGLTISLPQAMGFVEAAALPVNALTALYALNHRARVTAGDLVVVHGAAGGLGTACIQVAVDAGADVVAVVSAHQRGELAIEAGASTYVLATPDWARRVREIAATRGLPGATLVADPVGGDRLIQSLRCLAPEGRLVSLGFVGGIPHVGVNKVLVRNIDLIGVDWIPNAPVTQTVLIPALERMLAAGRLRPFVTATGALEDARPILAALQQRSLVGKAVLAR